jgi:hypothetical protein
MEPQVHAPPPSGSAPLVEDKVLHMVGDVWVLSVGHVVAYGEEVEGGVVDVGGGGGVLNVHVLIGEGEHGRGVIIISIVHLWRRGFGFKDIVRRHDNPLGNELQGLDNELRSMPCMHHPMAERAPLLAVKGVLTSAHSAMKFDTSHITMSSEADTVSRNVKGMYTTHVHNQGPLAPSHLDVVQQVVDEWEHAMNQHPMVHDVRQQPQGAPLVGLLRDFARSVRPDPLPNPILLGTSFPQRHIWGRAQARKGWTQLIEEGEGGGGTHQLEAHMGGMSLSDTCHARVTATGTQVAPTPTPIPPHAIASAIAKARRAAIEGVAQDIAMLHPPRGAFLTGPPHPQVHARRQGHMAHHESCSMVQPMHGPPTTWHHHAPKHMRRLPHVEGKLPTGKHGVARFRAEVAAVMYPTLDAIVVMEQGVVPLAKAHHMWQEGLDVDLHAPHHVVGGEGAQGGVVGERLLTDKEGGGGNGKPDPSQPGGQAAGGEGAYSGTERKKGRQLTQHELVQKEEDMRLWKKPMVS